MLLYFHSGHKLVLFVHNRQLSGCDSWKSDMLEILSSSTEWIWLWRELTYAYTHLLREFLHVSILHLKHMQINLILRGHHFAAALSQLLSWKNSCFIFINFVSILFLTWWLYFRLLVLKKYFLNMNPSGSGVCKFSFFQRLSNVSHELLKSEAKIESIPPFKCAAQIVILTNYYNLSQTAAETETNIKCSREQDKPEAVWMSCPAPCSLSWLSLWICCYPIPVIYILQRAATVIYNGNTGSATAVTLHHINLLCVFPLNHIWYKS